MLKFYNKKEYQLIANIYGLGKISMLSYFYGGLQTPKVRIKTQLGEFVISKNKLSNKKDIASKSKESLQYEIDLLNSLKGLPVPSYYPSLKGNFIEKFNDGWVTVDKYIPGKAPKKITPKIAYSLGVFLGEFHNRGQRFKKKLKSRRRFYDLNPRVMKVMKPLAFKQTHPKLKSIREEMMRGVENNFPSSKLPKGPIHVDIYYNNELFLGNKLSGIIDFGNFYIGPLMIDVGKTIMWNCCLKGKFNKKLFKEFIRGYKSKRKFNKFEKAYLKKSILYAIYSHIWVDLYHVPIKYVPESWPLFLAKNFLSVARKLEKSDL